MMGVSHALTGVVTGVITYQVTDASIPAGVVAATIVVGASLFPDLDHSRSTVSNTGGFLTRGLSWALRRATGGHRTATHSILGVAVTALLAQAAITYRGEVWSIAVLAVILFLCWAAPIRLLKIRGWWDDVLPPPLAIGAAWWPGFPLELMPHALVIGMSVHIIGDMITKQGCPLLWPVKGRTRLLTLKAGGPVERFLLRPAFVVAIPVAVCWDLVNPLWLEAMSWAARH
ncbi:metal-dependent hydrolase [Nonomuraea sp. NPDC050786]|uniref:metal-dependent hydrolase n=1 Tax=Nonomuraea sp. NPDC050786 TaxID=3154840 RepID=UPI0033CC616D